MKWSMGILPDATYYLEGIHVHFVRLHVVAIAIDAMEALSLRQIAFFASQVKELLFTYTKEINRV